MAAYPLGQAVALTLLTLPVATSAALLRQPAAPLPDHAIPSAPRSTESRPMRYTAPSRPGTIDLILRREGSRLILLDAGALAASADLANTSEVLIGGPDQRDTSLTVDYAFGPIPIPIDYHPGALGPRTNNRLTIRGASFDSETHSITGPHSGVIALDHVPIVYSNLTPVYDVVPAVNFTFIAAPTVTVINIVDGPIFGGFQTDQINDGGTNMFALINFANKTTVTVHGPSNAGTITADYSLAAAGLATLIVNSGPTAGTVFNALRTPAAVTTNFVGNLVAAVNVGNAGSVQGILGTLNIENLPRFNANLVDDSSDSTGRIVTLSSFSPNASDSESNADLWGKINGLAPGDINYERSDTTALTTDGGSGGNVFIVNDTISVGTTTINGGGGTDTFNIAANDLGGGSTNKFNGQGGDDTFAVTGSLGSLVTLDIDGGPGMDTLSVPAGSTMVPTGPDSGSVTGVVTNYTSIETGPGPSPTPTATPTTTPTATPTSTPTPTLAALGNTCTSGTQCASTFCAPDGVCCNVPCAEPNQSCTLPGSVGLCRVLGGVAPTVSRPGLIMLSLVLAALGVVSLRRTLIARR